MVSGYDPVLPSVVISRKNRKRREQQRVHRRFRHDDVLALDRNQGRATEEGELPEVKERPHEQEEPEEDTSPRRLLNTLHIHNSIRGSHSDPDRDIYPRLRFPI